MGKTMQEVIKENHKKSYEEHMRKIKKQNKKRHNFRIFCNVVCNSYHMCMY